MFNKGIAVLAISFLAFAGTLQAQDLKNVKISQLSDQQMMQVWQQFNAKGMSESEAVKTMIQKGLSPNEVGVFKKRLLGIQSAQKAKFGAKPFIKDTSMFMNDSSWINEVPFVRSNSKYYGYDFFSNPNTDFQPNFNVTTPQSYVLGTGDELVISLYGMNETEIEAKVNKGH